MCVGLDSKAAPGCMRPGAVGLTSCCGLRRQTPVWPIPQRRRPRALWSPAPPLISEFTPKASDWLTSTTHQATAPLPVFEGDLEAVTVLVIEWLQRQVSAMNEYWVFLDQACSGTLRDNCYKDSKTKGEPVSLEQATLLMFPPSGGDQPCWGLRAWRQKAFSMDSSDSWVRHGLSVV